ncbi:MAG: DNA recombination protein RmuC [Victivallaceae bacterium]|nr:DNA recombination protein RmuC [Victivallaceae bacterium]
MNFVFLIGGVFTGAVAVFLLLRGREQKLRGELVLAEKEKTMLAESHARETAARAEAFAAERRALKENASELARRFDTERADQEKNWKVKADLLREEFKNLSEKLLTEKSGSLQKNNREQMEAIITPLQQRITEFKTAFEEVKTKNVELGATLRSQFEKMLEATKKIGTEADNLAAALKGNNKTQGNWGEMILEEILRNSGLRRGVHYECQATLRDESGAALTNELNSKMRPDVVVHYPDGADVIIDSKVSLAAYTDYMNAETDDARAEALARHVRSVRSHVDELVRKNYSAYVKKSDREAVDFVIMFIPNEAPHQLAMMADPGLWREAFDRKVLIVSPVNLMALLQIIQIAWTRADQERNQAEILKTASMLLERLYAFYDDFDKIGTQLDAVRDSYVKAGDKLKGGAGKHSIVGPGEKLRQLGVRMKREKSLPERLRPANVETDDETTSLPFDGEDNE